MRCSLRISLWILAACVCLAGATVRAGYGFFANGGTYVILNVDGGGDTYYHLSPTSAILPTYHLNDFGSFEQGVNTFVLRGFENNTFENDGDGVMNGNLSYRIYVDGNPSGVYTVLPHNNFTPLIGAGNKRHSRTDASVNILDSLGAGNYVLELYAWAEVDWNPGDSFPNDIIYADNTDTPDATRYQSALENAFLFQSSFTITETPPVSAYVPEPGTFGLLALGAGLLRMLRRRTVAASTQV